MDFIKILKNKIELSCITLLTTIKQNQDKSEYKKLKIHVELRLQYRSHTYQNMNAFTQRSSKVIHILLFRK